MITEEQLVAAGVKKLSKILLSLYTSSPNLQKQLDIIFAGLEENPKKLISAIKQFPNENFITIYCDLINNTVVKRLNLFFILFLHLL